MRPEDYDDIHIDEIRKEYLKIDSDWLMLHYKVSVGLVLFALLIECAMAFLFIHSDMLTTSVGRYIWKFIIAPSGINVLCIFADAWAMGSKKLTQKQKVYVVSLGMAVISFVLFTVHTAFPATYFIYVVAIMLTTIYANYRVTSVTAALCIVSMVLSELFITWDVDKITIYESTLRLGNFLVSLFILIACSFVCMVQIQYERKKNEASIQKEIERQKLMQGLRLDELTGVNNRKALHDAMRDMEANEISSPLFFIIADIDHFKDVNDQFGHHIGDRCLRDYSSILVKYFGKQNVYRYGGDEFCLFHQSEREEEVISLCEQVQLRINELQYVEHPTLNLTISFGIALYTVELNAARLFIHADQALYQAKDTRNAIRVFQNCAA